MLNRLNEFLKLIKELQALIAALGLSGVLVANNLEKTIIYAEKFNLHILFTMLFLSYLTFKLSNKRIDKVENKLEQLSIKSAKDQLRGQVKQLAKDLQNIKVIDKQHTIKYIYDLEERRQELKLNSYTEATLIEMIKRIKK